MRAARSSVRICDAPEHTPRADHPCARGHPMPARATRVSFMYMAMYMDMCSRHVHVHVLRPTDAHAHALVLPALPPQWSRSQI